MPRKGQGQKIQTATGQQYGEATQQEESQRAMPLPRMAQFPTPGEVGPITRPTERPDEDLLTPGGGLPPRAPSSVSNEAMAALTPLMEMVASQPFASAETKKLLRQVRVSNSTNGIR